MPDDIDKFLAESKSTATEAEPDEIDKFLAESRSTTTETEPDEIDKFLAESKSTTTETEPDEIDKFLATPAPESALKTGAREAGMSALPTFASVAAGVKGGSVGFAMGGVPGAIIGGIGSALLASWGVSKAQEGVLNKILTPDEMGQLQQQMEANREAHPVAAWAGSMVPQAVTMKPNIQNATRAVQFVNDWIKTGRGAKVLASEAGKQELDNLLNVTVGATTSAGMRIYEKIKGGDVSWLEVLRDAAAGAVLNDPTRVGKAFGVQPTKLDARGVWAKNAQAVPPSRIITPQGAATQPVEVVSTDNASRPVVPDAGTEAAPPSWENKRPEQMSPEENLQFGEAKGVKDMEKHVADHNMSIAWALTRGSPVSKAAVEAYGKSEIAKEYGYIPDGDMLVKPAKPPMLPTEKPVEVTAENVQVEEETPQESFFRVIDKNSGSVIAENVTEAQAKELARGQDQSMEIKQQPAKVESTKIDTGKLVDNPESASGRTRKELMDEIDRRALKPTIRNLIQELKTANTEAKLGSAGLRPKVTEDGVIEGWMNQGAVYPEGLDKRAIPALERFMTGSKMTGNQLDQVETALNYVINRTFANMPKETITAGNFEKGDVVNIDGDPHKVIEKNTDGSIVLKDGTTQTLQPNEPLTIDQNSWKLAEVEEGKASETPFSIERRTLPRRVEAITPPDIDPKTGQIISKADIRRYLSEALDIPIFKGGYQQPVGIIGIFKSKPETIRLKMLNDLETSLHEIGHYLHFLSFNDAAGRQAQNFDDFNRVFDHELLKIGRGSSKPGTLAAQMRQEGVAEFVKEWIVDPTSARAVAPDFAAHWENNLKYFPEIAQTLENARDMYQIWQKAPALAKVKSMIVRSVDAIKEKTWPERWNKFRSDWDNSYQAIENTLKQAELYGADPVELDVIRQKLNNYRGGWRGKVESALNNKSLNLASKEIGESMRDILKGVDDLNNLDSYLAAKRAVEQADKSLETGFDIPAARKVVSDFEKQYEGIRKRLLTWQHQQRDLLVESGVLSRDAAMAMDLLNNSYVPFYRVYEALSGRSIAGGTGQGFVNLGAGVFRFKGSDREILSPLESMIRNAYAFRDLAERNQVSRLMMDMISKLQGGGRIADDVTSKLKPVSVTPEEIKGFLQQSDIIKDMAAATGIDEKTVAKDMVSQLRQNKALLTIWRQAQSTSNKQGIFSVWKNGKETLWQIRDPELYRAMSMADESDAKLMAKWPGLKIIAAATRLLRAGATLSPDFIARNIVRDQITASIYAETRFLPFWDGFKGVLSAINKDQWYWEWKKGGGSYSDFMMGAKGGLTETLKDVVKDPGKLEEALSWVNPLNVIKNLEKASEFIERGTRIAVFRRAIESGFSLDRAGNLSKETTLNYAKHGYKAYLVNKMSAFFNASIRDFEKMMTTHAKLFSDNPVERQKAMSVIFKASSIITLPSILTWYVGKDDPEIQALPGWQKALFWNVNLKDVAGEPFMLKIPKPFLLGLAYGTAVEAGLDYAYKKDPKLAGEWVKQVLAQLPNPISMVTPQIVMPIRAGQSNYDWFTNRKIVPDSASQLENWQQYTPDTSEVAKYVGKVLDISPLKIDFYIRAYTGGLGRLATEAVDATLMHLINPNTPEKPAKRWYDYPGVKVWHSSPYAADKYVDAFYKGYETAEKRNKSFSAMFDTNIKIVDMGWFNNNKNALMYYQMKDGDRTMLTEIRQVGSDLSLISKAMILVQNSKLDPETKRQRLIKLNQTRNKLAKAAYENLLHPDDR